jgi:hypothetical protein
MKALTKNISLPENLSISELIDAEIKLAYRAILALKRTEGMEEKSVNVFTDLQVIIMQSAISSFKLLKEVKK